MKPSFTILLFAALSSSIPGSSSLLGQSERSKNTVVLDSMGVRNLRIETVPVEYRHFEKTVFAIGRVEEIPANNHSVSSRIPGRAVSVHAYVGDLVKAGQVLVRVESRQPGDPPPVIDLTALKDGVVVASHVLTGQPVQPDSDLLDISDRSEVWVVARIPEQMAAGITLGTKARIAFPALGDQPVEAALLRFGVEADREAGTVDGIFQIPNPGYRLQPGMRAEFSIITGQRSGVLAVPEESVQGDPARRVIFVKDFDLPNAFVKSPVVLGEKGGGWIEVLSGVFPGDEVVTQGSYPLGFVGKGGLSLKEALDAAHGHEHNEDGSEITPQQLAAKANSSSSSDSQATSISSNLFRFLLAYSIGITLLTLFLSQLLWKAKQTSESPAPNP